MGTKKQPDPRQTELWRDYHNAQSEIEIAIEKLRRSVQALVASGYMPKEIAKAAQQNIQTIEDGAQELRSRLNHVIHYQGFTKRLNFNEIWRIVYARLREATGIDVIARALAAGKKCYLDMVQELGLLGKTLEIAGNL